jgi:hypothetical protein
MILELIILAEHISLLWMVRAPIELRQRALVPYCFLNILMSLLMSKHLQR